VWLVLVRVWVLEWVVVLVMGVWADGRGWQQRRVVRLHQRERVITRDDPSA
jgi:hypothetical protein